MSKIAFSFRSVLVVFCLGFAALSAATVSSIQAGQVTAGDDTKGGTPAG
ncbi:hypothetical protein [Deinococcus aquaedulcis]|nr:hypothetical protein [Deinococcus aquaedulcis]